MKKNLRNVLVLGLGLITTIASAQWSATSNTWIDNADDNRSAVTRSTVTMDMSGVHISADYTWTSGDADYFPSMSGPVVYEAYVSTNLMGFADLTLGRQDLSFGSGALLSSNDWGWSRWTTDGADFAANFGGIDFNLGTYEMGKGGLSTATTYMNASGSFSGFSINALMIDNDGTKSTGYDLGYSMMDGKLNLNYSMNDANGAELKIMGGSYNVMNNITIHAEMREYGGTGNFLAANSAWTSVDVDGDGIGDFGGLEAGVLPHLANGSESTSYGVSGSFSGIGISYTMHTITSPGLADQEFNDMSLSYDLNDNCTIGYRSYEIDGVEYNFATLNIGL